MRRKRPAAVPRDGAGEAAHRRLREQEGVLFRIASHVLEDAPLPVALHVVPVLDDAVADGVVDGVLVGPGDGLVADPEVHVLHALPLLPCRRLGIFRANHRRNDVRRLHVRRVTCGEAVRVSGSARGRVAGVEARAGCAHPAWCSPCRYQSPPPAPCLGDTQERVVVAARRSGRAAARPQKNVSGPPKQG